MLRHSQEYGGVSTVTLIVNKPTVTDGASKGGHTSVLSSRLSQPPYLANRA